MQPYRPLGTFVGGFLLAGSCMPDFVRTGRIRIFVALFLRSLSALFRLSWYGENATSGVIGIGVEFCNWDLQIEAGPQGPDFQSRK